MPTQKTYARVALVLSVLLALAFASAGISKLLDLEAAGQGFERFGYPAWLALLVGTCEVLGAVGLLIARLRLLAASGLVIIMLGAITSHLLNDPVANAAAPAALLVILAVVIALGRGRGSEASAEPA